MIELENPEPVRNVVANSHLRRGARVGLHFEQSGCVVFAEASARADLDAALMTGIAQA